MEFEEPSAVDLGHGVVRLLDLDRLPTEREPALTILRRLLNHAWAHGAHRVEAQVPVDDSTTRILLQHAGLRPEGVARGAGLDAQQRPVDMTRLARLNDDPLQGTPQAFLAMLNASLPTKRLIAQGLVRDGAGRVLLCELTYKKEWDLPGGVADGGESPAHTLAREVAEEFGLELPVGRLLAVDWLPPYRQWADALLLVFDLGIQPDLAGQVTLQPSEIRAVHWVDPGSAEQHVAPYVARLLSSLQDVLAAPGMDGVETGQASGQDLIYLEDGVARSLPS